MVSQRADYTFKHNMKLGRHSWLRLTPAYSAKAVQHILDAYPDVHYVLDPFAGSGTTGLVCAERGIRCDLVDINPFLVWFGEVKVTNYQPHDLQDAETVAQEMLVLASAAQVETSYWTPSISNIERWWSPITLESLALLYNQIQHRFPERTPAKDILLVAFCQLLIQWSRAAFNHQSMSFHSDEKQGSLHEVANDFLDIVQGILSSAQHDLAGRVSFIQADACCLPLPPDNLYDTVITSPPYPNRMSYIRELRPYMYWLGYLETARQAGEMDWQSIGGTWGIATSRLNEWKPNGTQIVYQGFDDMIDNITLHSPVLARYVHKYFLDIWSHLKSVREVVQPGGRVFYVVGNSKFYDTLVPVEAIYAALLKQHGFVDIQIEVLRKRNSKKELLEFIVSGCKDRA